MLLHEAVTCIVLASWLLKYWAPGPDSRNYPLAIGSNTILWSWPTDRFHKRRSQSAHQIGKYETKQFIANWIGNLELTLRDRDWMKNVRLMISIRRHLWVQIRERHGQFSARTPCCSRYNTVWTCHIWQVCVCDKRHRKYTNCWHKTDHVPVNVSR